MCFKHFIAYIIAIFTYTASLAQAHIPASNNASAIVEVNLPAFVQYANYEQLNQSKATRNLLDKLLQRPQKYDYVDDSVIAVQQYGIDFNRKIYTQTITTDSCVYTLSLIPVANNKLFKDYIITTTGAIGSNAYAGGEIFKTDKKSLVYIGASYAIAAKGKHDNNFFTDSANAKRYDIEKPAYPYINVATDTATAIYDEGEYDEEVEDTTEAVYDEDSDTLYEDVDEYAYKEDDEESDYANTYATYLGKLDSLSYAWTEDFVKDIIHKNQSIHQQLNSLKQYKPQSANALVSYYSISNFMNAYNQMYKQIFGLYGLGGSGAANNKAGKDTDWTGYHLRMDGKKMVLNGGYYTSPENTAIFKKVYDKKLNKKLLKYINEEKDALVFTSAVNTHNYFKESPMLVANLINAKPKEISAASIVAELFSIALDEKELSRLFMGDALFAINGYKEIEIASIKYTTDEENFSTKADTVLKIQKIPTLIAMFTTAKGETVSKWLRYAAYKDWLSEDNKGIYSIKKTSNQKYRPSYLKSFEKYFSGHFFQHKGIVFFATEMDDVHKIKNRTYKSKLSKNVRREILNNNMYSYTDINDMVSLFLSEEEKISYKHKLQMLDKLYIKSRITDDKDSGTSYILEVSDQYSGNALQLLLDLMGEIE